MASETIPNSRTTCAVSYILEWEPAFRAKVTEIIDTATWDGQRWQGVERAAERLKFFVTRISHRDLRGLDSAEVDWMRLVRGYLGARNMRAGRDFFAGT